MYYIYIYIYVYIYMIYVYIYPVWTEFSGHGIKSHSGQLSLATSKNLSVLNILCISSFWYTRSLPVQDLLG